jgi:hypothetical protein
MFSTTCQVKRGDTVMGSVPQDLMDNQLAQGFLVGSDLVSTGKGKTWTRIDQVPELPGKLKRARSQAPRPARKAEPEVLIADEPLRPARPVLKPDSRLTQCPDCGAEVSLRAVSCPRCAAPLVEGSAAQFHGGVQTIQATSKKLKGQLIASSLLAIVGTVGIFTAASDPKPQDISYAVWMLFIGFAWFIVTRFRIRWNHR